ncbi:MAG TPA: RNA polymerase sigma factor [Enhygromyxa sp.]|nr:RNA polymerase sigma factor [Enhygromyxa sp.]
MPARDQPALSAEFEALYHAHFEFVWRLLRRFGVPVAALDDATQDVFVVVHRRFGAWEQRASVRAWLFGVAKRVAANHRRGLERHARKVAALPEPATPRLLDERVADRDHLEQVAKAIDGLAPERREVYVLAYLEGLSAPEIADALGCKLNTVYSRLRRARAELAAALAEQRSRDEFDPADMVAAGIGQRSDHGRAR